MKKINVLGIDLSKNVFQLHGVDKDGKAVLRKKISRKQLALLISNLPPCLIGMEACGGAHFWAREFIKLGHEVRLMAPQFVKPYVKTNKNDAADAEAICEAVTRPNMRFVPIKNVEQQDIQSLHRIRERLIVNQTALANEIRGLLHEYGIIMPQGHHQIRKLLPEIIEDANNQLTGMSRSFIFSLLEEFIEIQKEVKKYNDKIEDIFKTNENCQRIEKVPGVGPVTATAIVASVGNGKAFKNGRQMSAWMGLVPKQNSSGGKEKLLGISKRGDKYLRRLLIHGARAVLYQVELKEDPKSLWLKNLIKTRGFNKACVALANKNARTIWAILSSGENYRAA